MNRIFETSYFTLIILIYIAIVYSISKRLSLKLGYLDIDKTKKVLRVIQWSGTGAIIYWLIDAYHSSEGLLLVYLPFIIVPVIFVIVLLWKLDSLIFDGLNTPAPGKYKLHPSAIKIIIIFITTFLYIYLVTLFEKIVLDGGVLTST